MLRKFLITGCIVLIVKFSHAQLRESKVIVDSLPQSAVYFETDLPEDDIKQSLDNFFAKYNVIKDKGKGFIFKKQLPFITYRHAVVDTMDGQMLDYYFKVDTRKQKGPDVSTVYVVAGKGYKDYVSPENNKKIWDNLLKLSDFLRTNYFEQQRITGNLATLTKELTKSNSKLSELEAEVQKTKAVVADKITQINTMNVQLGKLKGIVIPPIPQAAPAPVAPAATAPATQ